MKRYEVMQFKDGSSLQGIARVTAGSRLPISQLVSAEREGASRKEAKKEQAEGTPRAMIKLSIVHFYGVADFVILG